LPCDVGVGAGEERAVHGGLVSMMTSQHLVAFTRHALRVVGLG
jgi:hypothetical protein